MSKKILVCEYHEESNSFNPVIMQKERFYTRDLSAVDGFRPLCNTISVIGGIATEFCDGDFTYCGTILMSVMSGGPVSDESVERFLTATLPAIEREKPDGIAVSLHGATVSETSEDVCGDILQKIRAAAGEDAVIGAAFDLHANVTEKTMRAADFICGYQTYPHVDHYLTGRRIATLMKQRLAGKRLKTVYVSVPMIAPPHAYTTGQGKLKELMEYAAVAVSAGRIADFSVFQAQPWLDVTKLASTVVVTGENEAELGRFAHELAEKEFALRDELQGEKQASVQDVIEAALANDTGRPVVLGDAADSPNAGATGDCADLIAALLPYRDKLTAAVCISDAPAVEKLFAAGVGAVVDVTLGATLAPQISRPVTVEKATVKSLHMGTFTQGYPYRGAVTTIGRTAVLQVGKLHILVAAKLHGGGNLQFYRGFGIDPELCQLVCVKACTSFRACYEPIAVAIYSPVTNGAAGTALTALPFKNLPHPLYPFDEITENDIGEAKSYR